jgi:glutamine cyclotransferase
MFHFRHLLAGLVLAFCLLCADSFAAAPVLGYKVLAHYPHSTENYTEGFFYLDRLGPEYLPVDVEIANLLCL